MKIKISRKTYKNEAIYQYFRKWIAKIMTAKVEHFSRKKSIILMLLSVLYFTTARMKKPGMIYILEWTTRLKEPFSFMQMKRESFTRRGCLYQNCYITDNTDYFEDVTEFDVILFNVVSLLPRKDMILPESRTDEQLYIFVSTESASNYPIGPDFNMFFNWTWTYKLNSDITFPYIAVWNKHGEVIGPAYNISWVKRMKPTSDYVKDKLRNKRIAAAWFVSNCEAHNKRVDFVTKLQNAMAPYGLKLDVYGNCGSQICPRERIEECYGLLETNYYFYLAFENSFDDDYVTEKVLTAVEHFTVPVLFGGANYSRFMPKGMYIDARVLGPKRTAKKMSKAIRNRDLYYDYFRFHGYYIFHAAHDNSATNPVCTFCAMLNDKRRRDERRAYAHFTQWWNGIQPGESADDPILYFNTTTDSHRSKSKVYIDNPNKHALILEENKGGPLLNQIINYFFER